MKTKRVLKIESDVASLLMWVIHKKEPRLKI